MTRVPPALARKTWRTLEPIHAMIYFVPEAPQRYAEAGIADPRSGYFASRSAPLGTVPVEVVIATFFNFCPSLVRRAMRGVWDSTTPEKVLNARLEAVDAALRRALGDVVDSTEMAEAAALARTAALAACDHPEGRPLFAAHAAMPWPDAPHLVLWHAQTLLREFRGDGHIAALVAEGISGIEALILHAATSEVPVDFLRVSRAWPDEEWELAAHRLRGRGLLAEGRGLALTTAGRAHREWVEQRTDEAAAPA